METHFRGQTGHVMNPRDRENRRRIGQLMLTIICRIGIALFVEQAHFHHVYSKVVNTLNVRSMAVDCDIRDKSHLLS